MADYFDPAAIDDFVNKSLSGKSTNAPAPTKIAKVPGAADADSHRLLAQELANAQAKLGNNDPRVADDIAALKREIARIPGTPALIPPPVAASAPAQTAAPSSSDFDPANIDAFVKSSLGETQPASKIGDLTRAAFGIYPKQRATPSSEATKAAIEDFTGNPSKETFDVNALYKSGGAGAVIGAVAPPVLKYGGKAVGFLPGYGKPIGATMQFAGEALRAVPIAARTAAGAAYGAGSSAIEQGAELAGAPKAAAELAGLLGPGAIASVGRKVGGAIIGEAGKVGETVATAAPVSEKVGAYQAQKEAAQKTALMDQLKARLQAQQESALASGAAEATAGQAPTAYTAGLPSAGGVTSNRQSVGASAVDAETGRIAQAQQLYDPISLSKDQATRNAMDVRFARETAKSPEGQAFQEKYASDNAKLINNLDIHINKTGAELTGTGPGELGQALANVVAPYQARIKATITPAYDAARAAGQMAEPVDVAVFRNYLAKHQAEAINAPVLQSVEKKLQMLTEGNPTISVNDLEEIRKMTGTLAQSGGPNSYYGRQVIKMIDKATEGKGGPLYQQARKLNADYMQEFENTPVIKNILAMKPGKTTRSVAIEDLVDKSLLRGPRSDVEQLFNSLNKSGPEGQQMVNEMRGFVAQKIRDEATKSVTKDVNGLPYVSSHKLNAIITDLDKSGKLEYIFGKELADKYRTINDVAKDVLTVPQGAVNTSNTASTLLGAMAEMSAQHALADVDMPIPIMMIGKHFYGKRQAANKQTKINEFINYTKPKPGAPAGAAPLSLGNTQTFQGPTP